MSTNDVAPTRVGTPPAAAELVERIGWLINLRWLAVVGVAGFLEVARRAFPVELEMGRLHAVLAGLAIYNGVLALIHRRLRAASPAATPACSRFARILLPGALLGLEGEGEAVRAAVFANLQITFDLIALALLLHFGGGLENPFIIFFVFHVIIASILLSRPATYLHTTLGFGLIATIGIGECVGLLRHFPLEGGVWRAGAYQEPKLVAAQLFVFGVTLFLAAYMGSTIAEHLRYREREAALLARAVAEQAAELDGAYRRLQAVESAKSQYMRKVSHELRGPLGTIQTALKVVLQRAAAVIPPEPRDLLERAERRAGELAEVTHDLLALSRAREGRLAVERTDVDLAAVVREQVADAAGDAERAGVTLAAEVPSDAAVVLGDARDLCQLCRNLLSNAIRYTPAGGRVAVRLDRQGERVRLEVEDSGIGIPEADLPRVFEEFFRCANARERVPAGTGLGLAIVRSAAEQHGGTVAVVSSPGRGTCFSVELPAAPPGDGSRPSAGPSPCGRAGDQPLS